MDSQDYLCVLLVENDDRDARELEEILTASHHIEFVVSRATSADVACRMLEEDTYDSVLLDYDLGGQDGFELVHRLDRTDLFTPPIIMFSKDEDRGIDLKAQEMGLGDFLLWRDINTALLERVIRYALDHTFHERHLKWLAFYDQLTELPNRAYFSRELNQRLERSNVVEDSFPLILLDIDRLKDINAEHGHQVGDELLQMVGQRLMIGRDEGDFVARLGGDEFVVILRKGLSPERIEMACRGIQDLLSDSYGLENCELNASVCLGVSMYSDHGTTYSELLKCADLALIQAKAAGDGSWRMYQPAPQHA